MEIINNKSAEKRDQEYELRQQIAETQAQLSDLEKERRELILEIYAEERGLSVGRFLQNQETREIFKVTAVCVVNPDYLLSCEGYRVKKDGTVGKQWRKLWFGLDTYKFVDGPTG